MRFLSTLLASTLGALLALGIVLFFTFIFILALAASAEEGAPSVRSGSVLVMELDGPLPEVVSQDPLAQALRGEPSHDLRGVKQALRMAAADDRIEGLWLQVRDVSGFWASWATLQEVHNALLAFKESGKPIYASSDDYGMDEAGYFLASVADSVFASPQSFFEFNGFTITAEFYKRALDMLDVEAEIVRAGAFKAAGEAYSNEQLSDENEAQLRAFLDALNETFMEGVAMQRGMKPEALRTLASDTALLTAENAVAAGLLDGLRYHAEIAELFKSRLGYDEDDDLEEISLKRYARVSPEEAGLEVAEGGEIALVYAVGTIVSGESGTDPNPLLGGTNLGAETLIEAMRKAREDDDVKAVVLRVNSPGGSASASDAMWYAIHQTSAVKPVIVSMGDVAASGGYWIATAADAIVADPLTITGSIGVISVLLNTRGFFANKLGITFDQVQTSPYADMLSSVGELTGPERALLQESVMGTYQAFLKKVAKSQEMTVEQVDSLAQGRIWSGLAAQEIGLVDELGDLDTALDLAAERAGMEPGAYRLRILPRPKSFAEEVSDLLNVRAAQAWLNLRTSPAERAVLRQAQTLRRVLETHGQVQARLPLEIVIR